MRAREGADGGEVDGRGWIRPRKSREDGWRIDKVFKLSLPGTFREKMRNFKFLE